MKILVCHEETSPREMASTSINAETPRKRKIEVLKKDNLLKSMEIGKLQLFCNIETKEKKVLTR